MSAVPSPIRTITLDDLSDSLEKLVEVKFSDEELAVRGIVLDQADTLRVGLGPSAYTIIELESGHQYLLERLEYMPETLSIVGTLTEQLPALLIERVLTALAVPEDRVVWAASDDHWTDSRRSARRHPRRFG